MARKKMDDTALEALANREIEECTGFLSDAVTQEREDAMARYNGEPYGDEKAGRSAVVTRDVLDTIEWMMPSLLRIFTSGDVVAEFQPVSPDDEPFCQQATEYIDYVFQRDNQGFLILHDWMKDAVLQKVGIVKHWWDEREETTVEEYSGLDDAQFYSLVSDDDVEVEEHSEEIEEETGVRTHDLKIRVKKDCSRVRIEAVPPEEFLVSSRSKSIDDARFVGHRRAMSRSELIEMGYDRETIEGLGSGSDDIDMSGERQTRFNDELWDNQTAGGDESMAKVTYIEGYLRADVNDDGIAELVKVCLAGSGKYKLLASEEVARVPFSTLCPIRIPHKLFGMSVADLVTDIQRIKTTILRGTLDSLYLSLNPMTEVEMPSVINLDDFLMSRPGGIRRVQRIGASREIQTPFVGQAAFPMLEYMDAVKQERTGSSPMAAADAEQLQNQTATAVSYAQQAATQRIELIARIFAETGIKDLFKNLLEIIVAHQDAPRTIRIRNKWVTVDPRGWSPDLDVSINVGLGHGDQMRQAASIGQVLQLQAQVIQGGGMNVMVKPKQIYNAIAKMVNLAGFKNVDQFISDPGDVEFPPTQGAGDPNASLAQAEVVKAQTQAQTAQAKMQAEFALKQQDMAKEVQLERERMQAEIAIAREKMLAEIELERMKAAHDVHMSDRKAITDAAHDEGMAKLNAFLERANMVVDQARAAKGDESMGVMMQGMKAIIESVNAPKRVVRGPDGKVAGVETGSP